MNQVQKKYVILGSLCALVLTLAVGYAAFNTVLKINGTTNISSNWDIGITNIRAHGYGANNDTYDISEPTYTANTASFKTGLITPGTSREYEIEITNNGSLTGIITVANISCGDNEAIQCYARAASEPVYNSDWERTGDYKFFIGFGQDQDEIKDSYNILEPGEKHYIYLEVGYKSTVTSQPEKINADIKLELNYEQEGVNDEGIATPSEPFTGTLYSYDVNKTMSVGSKLKPTNTYVEDYNTLGKNIFLKNNVVNNIVESVEACFIRNNNLYCLKGEGDSSTHEANRNTLLTAFAGSTCDETEDVTICYDESWYAYAESSGVLTLSDGTYQIDYWNETDIWCN